MMPNDAKGRAAEYYIINTIEKTGHVYLPCKKIGSSTVDLTSKLDLDVAVERFHDLLPNKLPTVATMFVPSSPKYSDIDFLIFDPVKSSLHVVQVTVMAEPWRHSNTWKTGAPAKKGQPDQMTIYDHWVKFCKPLITSKIWFVAVPLDSKIQPKGNAKPKEFLKEYSDHAWVGFNDPDCATHFPILSSFKH